MANGKKGPNILFIVVGVILAALIIGLIIWGITTWQKRSKETTTTAPPSTTAPPTTTTSSTTTRPPTTPPPGTSTTTPPPNPTTTPSPSTTTPSPTSASGSTIATMPKMPGYSEFQSRFNGQYLGVQRDGKGGWFPTLVDYGGFSWRWDVSQVPGTNSIYLTDTASGNRLGIASDNSYYGGYKVNVNPGAVRTEWTPEDAGNGFIRLKNQSTGTYLGVCNLCPGWNPTGLAISAHHGSPDQAGHILWNVVNVPTAV